MPRPPCNRLMRAVIALLIPLVASSQLAFAESKALSPNATIRGDLSRLGALPSLMRRQACKADDCVLPLPPIHVALAVKGYAPMRIVFTEAEDTRHIRREGLNYSVYDIDERPILLRGVASVRHSVDGGGTFEVPVAGTIYRDEHTLQLEVAVTHMNRRAPGQMVIARALLGGDSIQGRAVRASSYAFARETCGTSHAHISTPNKPSDENTPPISQFATTKLFYIATDFDREFMAKAKCKTISKCNNKIVAFMNQTSVFYQKPMSIRFKVERQQGPTHLTGGASDAGEMITNYQSFIDEYYGQFMHDGVNTGARLVDGFAGFTGRNMNDRVIGIATLGAYCDNSHTSSASAVIRQASDSITPLVIAHEIGHNLNANHTTSGIMAPSVSRVGKKVQFSSVSVYEISSFANGWYGECRGGGNYTPPAGYDPYAPTIQIEVAPTPGYELSVYFSVKNKRPDCRVVARASESASTVDQGTIVLDREMGASGFRISTSLSQGIDASNDSDATVFFKGYYVCSGEQLRAQSAVTSYVAPRDPSYYSLVSRSAWIDYVRSKLLY